MFDSITQDGTYTLAEDGSIRDALAGVASGFVVATGAVAMESDVVPGSTFGRWEDSATGVVYWDHVKVYTDRAEAMDAGIRAGEIAIWDVANSQEIRL